MPIVTAYCRVKDGLGNPEQNPQVFLKVNGKFYRTHVHFDRVVRCEGGWTGSVIHYQANFKNQKDKEELRKLALLWLEQDQSAFALSPAGLKYSGIRFVF